MNFIDYWYFWTITCLRAVKGKRFLFVKIWGKGWETAIYILYPLSTKEGVFEGMKPNFMSFPYNFQKTFFDETKFRHFLYKFECNGPKAKQNKLSDNVSQNLTNFKWPLYLKLCKCTQEKNIRHFAWHKWLSRNLEKNYKYIVEKINKNVNTTHYRCLIKDTLFKWWPLNNINILVTL